MSDLTPKDSDALPLDYAHVLAVVPTRPMHSRKAVIVAWLIPCAAHVAFWFLYSDNFAWSDPVYVRTGVSAQALCGFWHVILILSRIIPQDGYYRFDFVAVVLWSLWLWAVTQPTFRRLSLALHFGLSVAWNLFSCLLVLATYG